MEIKKKVFDDFIKWLKHDGLKPRTSERIWKKTILRNLLNNDQMTLENYTDYQEYLDSQKNAITSSIDKKIDNCDYTRLIGLSLKTKNEIPKCIKRYQLADSRIHLFFECGGDALVLKEDIQNMLECSNEI